ncbi:MAG: phosphopantothenoylcysteine decarboxylase domain-containing protein, partial [bacterium JZ-2024 1]
MLSEKDFEGRKVVVTAGPTREPLDDVRFITNASTGRMGYAIALAALRRGADTTLVTGPCETTPPEGADIRRVTTAREMREHTLNTAAAADFVFMAAAVSDYAPARPLKGKPPKEQIGRIMHLELKRNPDILSDLARRKGKPSRVTIGFAAEWGKPDLARVQRKFVSKGLNGLFVNDISQTDIGFGSQVNEGWWLNEKGILVAVPRMPKEDLADILLDYALEIAGCKGQASRISSANPRR